MFRLTGIRAGESRAQSWRGGMVRRSGDPSLGLEPPDVKAVHQVAQVRLQRLGELGVSSAHRDLNLSCSFPYLDIDVRRICAGQPYRDLPGRFETNPAAGFRFQRYFFHANGGSGRLLGSSLARPRYSGWLRWQSETGPTRLVGRVGACRRCAIQLRGGWSLWVLSLVLWSVNGRHALLRPGIRAALCDKRMDRIGLAQRPRIS